MSNLIIHKRLKEARKSLNLNQTDIAKDLDIQQKTISDIENGKMSNIPNSYIYYFYNKGISLEWIYDNKGKMFMSDQEEQNLDKSLFSKSVEDKEFKILPTKKTEISELKEEESKYTNIDKKTDILHADITSKMYERLIDSKDFTIENLQSFIKLQENNIEFLQDFLQKVFNKKI